MRFPVTGVLILTAVFSVTAQQIVSFGEGGQKKMIYDRRANPNAIYFDNKIVFAYFGEGYYESGKEKPRTIPQAIVYDVSGKTFGDVVTIDTDEENDHHDGPVIWMDNEGYFHVYHDWHHTLGSHKISNSPRSIGSGPGDWTEITVPDQKMSYPSTWRYDNDKHLVFYRTDGHTSSWTYRKTDDNGHSWMAPPADVTDLDITFPVATDWSIYPSVLPSKDGKSLHMVFMAYDDVKISYPDGGELTDEERSARFYNPRYDQGVSYNYNLYYLNINLETDVVTNDAGEVVQTPVDSASAWNNAMIIDTDWRGSSVIPDIVLDASGQPAFLYTMSREDTHEEFDLMYVKKEGGEWKMYPITETNHEWQNGYITRDLGGLHAYLVVNPGEGYFNDTTHQDSHGGGTIAEWVSTDEGVTWTHKQDIVPTGSEYAGWIYHNPQPVRNPDGSTVPGLIAFYGWEKGNPEALGVGFLYTDPMFDPGVLIWPEDPADIRENINGPGGVARTLSHSKIGRLIKIHTSINFKGDLAVYNISGTLIKTLSPISGSYVWDGTDARSVQAGNGMYFVKAPGQPQIRPLKILY